MDRDTDTRTDGGTADADDVLGSPEESVMCCECNGVFGQITASHLSKHGMTVDEYREKYPDAPLVPDRVKRKSGWTGGGNADA